MNVTLISATPEAVNLLLFTKNTRLEMSPGLMAEIAAWSPEKKKQELAYMASTIRSSWEFVDFVFMVEGVSRACAQQMTRTRQASFAMQSQRVTDVRKMQAINPRPGDKAYAQALASGQAHYAALVDAGVPLEDARGVLPMNTACNLAVKYNLRAFVDVCAARESLRAQGEYGRVVREMKRLVLERFPEFEPFFESPVRLAIDMLTVAAQALGITTGHGNGWQIAKAIDLLRKG